MVFQKKRMHLGKGREGKEMKDLHLDYVCPRLLPKSST